MHIQSNVFEFAKDIRITYFRKLNILIIYVSLKCDHPFYVHSPSYFQ